MTCTINTDASFHPEYKVGAYAFWSVSSSFKIQKAGFLRTLCKSPDEAELKCLLNAIQHTLKHDNSIKKIYINTDSKNSIAILTNDRDHINKYGLHWGKEYRKLFSKYISQYENKVPVKYRKKIELDFRHVKAHTGINDKRSYVNEWCDKNAKFFLWRRIHQLKLVSNG